MENRATNCHACIFGRVKKVKASGGDVTQTLKQLGIKSTQEIDTMQRMAGAGDLLSRALKTANGAWKENNALTIEAKTIRNNRIST